MNSERWYYLDGETSVGPFNWQRLLDLFKATIIGPNTYVWREGTTEWVSLAGALQAKQPAPPPPPPRVPTRTSIEQTALVAVRAALEQPITATQSGIARQADLSRPSLKVGREWLSKPVAPWRRYAARMLDTPIHGVLGSFLVGYAWYSVAPATADQFFTWLNTGQGSLVNILLTTLIAALVGGVVVGTTGTSIGKAIFGVRVVSFDRKTIGVLDGLAREARVWWAGLGLGIPLVALVTMSVAFNKLKKQGSTSWDDENGCLVLYRPNGPVQYFLNGLGVILVLVALGIMSALSKM